MWWGEMGGAKGGGFLTLPFLDGQGPLTETKSQTEALLFILAEKEIVIWGAEPRLL